MNYFLISLELLLVLVLPHEVKKFFYNFFKIKSFNLRRLKIFEIRKKIIANERESFDIGTKIN